MNQKANTRLAALVLTGAAAAALPVHAAGNITFPDVSPDAWYAPAVEYCVENNLMNGTGEGLFDPDGVMTRGMLAAVLYRVAGSPENDGESGFPDVPDWCASALTWAAQAKIMTGYDDGRSGAGDPVTREQFVTMLWRYAGLPKTMKAEDFADEGDISPYASVAVDWSRLRGVINGREGNRFAPAEGTSRAEAAQILKNYRSRNVDSEGVAVNGGWGPSGVAAGKDGALMVTDTVHKAVWIIDGEDNARFAGQEGVLDLWGVPLGGYQDGERMYSFFKEPWAIAPFQDGWVVSDTENGALRLIQGNEVYTLTTKTSETLPLDDQGVVFRRPTGLAAGEGGELYVADTGEGAIRKVSAAGNVTTVAIGLQEPTGLFWKDGALYIAETGAHRIVKLENGAISLVAGSGEEGFADGPAEGAMFSSPMGVTVGEDGAVYIADTVNGAIRVARGGKVETLTQRDWAALEFYPVSPRGILVRGESLYVCDNFSRKLLILPLSQSGQGGTP